MKRIDEIGTDEIRKLVYREGVSAVCRNGDRRALHAFFEWSVLNGHCSSNPVRRLAPAKSDKKTPAILTLKEVESLLAAASDYKQGRVLPFIALSLFGGLRPNELAELAVLDLTGNQVRVDGCVAKLRKRRVVEGLDAAMRWLLPHQGRRICPPNFRRDFDAVRRMAGFRGRVVKKGDENLKPWVPDVLRHTALSYHYAKHKQEHETAKWAGNSPDTLHRNYKGLVTSEDAEVYWSLSPGLSARETRPSESP